MPTNVVLKYCTEKRLIAVPVEHEQDDARKYVYGIYCIYDDSRIHGIWGELHDMFEACCLEETGSAQTGRATTRLSTIYLLRVCVIPCKS